MVFQPTFFLTWYPHSGQLSSPADSNCSVEYTPHPSQGPEQFLQIGNFSGPEHSTQ